MPRHSLWPREHGAYFQLGIPLAVACLAAAGTAAVMLAIAAILAFLANEPLLVVLGHRGQRMRATDGLRARTRLGSLVLGAALFGIAGLVMAPATLAAATIAAIPAAAVVVLGWRRLVHTLLGELVAAVALTGASVPVLVANTVPLETALAMWAAWSIGFGATVLAIHRVIARHRRSRAPVDRLIAVAMIAVAVALVAIGSPIALPLVAVATILAGALPPASRLRLIGIAIAVAGFGSGALALHRLWG